MRKILLALTVALFMSLCIGNVCMAETQSGTCGNKGNNLTWVFEDGTLTISGNGDMQDYTPYSEAPWYDLSIERVVLQSGVTRIGNRAFHSCSDMTSIDIPDSVTSIAASAFSDCSSLASIILPNSVTSIGSYAFFRCNSLSNIIIPDGITSIEEAAFMNCRGLTNIILPDSVTSIGKIAFYGCDSLSSIIIPENVTNIEASAFSDCSSLTSITLPDSVTNIGATAFSRCSSLTSITLPDGITSIGESAFFNCSSLESIILPGSLTKIEASTFSSCSSLTSVTLPNGISSIGTYAFRDCRMLKDIDIPSSVTSIGYYSFVSSGIRNIVIWSNKTVFEDIMYNNVRPTIYCYEFSDAEFWAEEKKYPVKYLDNLDLNSIRKITLPESIQMTFGESKKIVANIFPTGDNPELLWNSTNSDIASVNDGIITANMSGTATITASIGNVMASTEVTVFHNAEDFNLSDEIWIISKNSVQLEILNVVPAEADIYITWSSSDESVAVVDENGVVTGKGIGDATIIATDVTGITKTMTVHVCYPVTAIEMQALESIYAGQTSQITANVTMRTQSCVNHLVSFSSSDESIASIDTSGLVKAIAPGTVELIATAENGISASCTFVVKGFDNMLTLPLNLSAIESEAFAGLEYVEAIKIPNSVSYIAPDAFDGKTVIIIASKGSYAIQWAKDNGFAYIEE